MRKKKVVGGTGITAGGDVTIGDVTGQIAMGKNITQKLILSPSDKKEFLESLVEFKKEIDRLNIPEDRLDKIKGYVSAAIVETRKENPDPSEIKSKFQSAIDTIKKAGGVIEKVAQSETCKRILSILGKLGLSCLL